MGYGKAASMHAFTLPTGVSLEDWEKENRRETGDMVSGFIGYLMALVIGCCVGFAFFIIA